MDTSNKFGVSIQGGNIVLLNARHVLSKDEALNLAAYLVSMADPGGDKFAEVLTAVQEA